MPRTTPEIERLTAECASLRRTIASLIADPGDCPVAGCGDTSCRIAHPQGMATNGVCRCDARAFRRALEFYKRLAAFRQETIRFLRDVPTSGDAEDERAAAVAFMRAEAIVNHDDGDEGSVALLRMATWIERGLHRKDEP